MNWDSFMIGWFVGLISASVMMFGSAWLAFRALGKA